MRPWLLTILCMLFLYTYAIQYYFASWVCWPYLCVVFHGSTPYVCCPSGLWLHKHAALVYICYPHLFCLIYILTTDGLPLLLCYPYAYATHHCHPPCLCYISLPMHCLSMLYACLILFLLYAHADHILPAIAFMLPYAYVIHHSLLVMIILSKWMYIVYHGFYAYQNLNMLGFVPFIIPFSLILTMINPVFFFCFDWIVFSTGL